MNNFGSKSESANKLFLAASRSRDEEALSGSIPRLELAAAPLYDSHMHIADLMRERPDTWGLRGDPHLWDEMERCFISVPLPEDRAALERLMQQCFEDNAGIPLEYEGEHFVPRFDTDGMSSGNVSPAFWRAIAIPLLLDRAERALPNQNRLLDALPARRQDPVQGPDAGAAPEEGAAQGEGC